MSDLRHYRVSLVLTSLCMSVLVQPTACSTYVEYEGGGETASTGSTTTSSSSGVSSSGCFSSQPPPECHTFCDFGIESGVPCMLEGQVCNRQEGDCIFQATCMGGFWFGGSDCPVNPPPPCVRCAEFVTGGVMASLCPESQLFFNDLMECICKRGVMDPVPGCMEICSDSACVTNPPQASPECSACIQSGSCKDPLNACINDI
ncbi:MAG TPA: hypothetical protein PKA58_25610 [Polyangium sp.]|nr:hypothetical protein [Polyangium sp.]